MKVFKDLKDFDFSASAVTIGFFDGLHLGHRALLENLVSKAKKKKLSSVVVTFDVHPRESLKATYIPRLLTTTKERLRLIEETGVEYCYLLEFTEEVMGMRSIAFLKKVLHEGLNAQYLIIGHDHHFGCDREHGFGYYKEQGKEFGIQVEQDTAYLAQGACVSSSLVRKVVEAGDMIQAQRLLGYDYFIVGRVVSGYKVGRTMGFPTANLAINDVRKLVPHEGVYAVELLIEGETERRKGMINLGTRPTFSTTNVAKSIELHILDFKEDIYQQEIRVFFKEFLRPEVKFDSPEKLSKQLKKDREDVKVYFGLKK